MPDSAVLKKTVGWDGKSTVIGMAFSMKQTLIGMPQFLVVILQTSSVKRSSL